MSRTLKHLVLLILIVATAGCGALFNTKVKTIAMTSTPAQAEVWIDGTMRGVTPLSLPLDNQDSHTVIFRKDGYEDVVCELSSNVGAGWVLLDLLGGLLPIIIDAATGDWKGIGEDSCNVGLPEDPDTPLAQLADENGWAMFQED